MTQSKKAFTKKAFTVKVYDNRMSEPILIHSVSVDAECSMEAICKAGQEICEKNDWQTLKDCYFGNTTSVAQFD